MGLASTLTVSLNGLNLNETAIDVLGNNIANAGTTAFKESNVRFETQLARTISLGTIPTSSNAGTNPLQFGLGATTAAVTQDFSQGSVTATTSPSDLAIQGNGFFIVGSTNNTGSPLYTRDGNFHLSSSNFLTNSQGQALYGLGVDANHNLLTDIQPISIPFNSKPQSQATTSIVLGGQLSPHGVVATQGTLQESQQLFVTGTATAVTGSTLLTNVTGTSGSATSMFAAGDKLSFTPSKGGRTLTARTFTVGATSTTTDFAQFLADTLGVQSSGVPNDGVTGTAPGGSIVNGKIRVLGNTGSVNDFEVTASSLQLNSAAGPMIFTPTQRSNGESTTTSFTMYDSLGTPLTVYASAVLEAQTNNSTTYRYFLESPDQSKQVSASSTQVSPAIAIGNSTITFDNQGHVANSTTVQSFTFDRYNTGASDPQGFSVDISQIAGVTPSGSVLNLLSQNGTRPGNLVNFSVDDSGRINGAYDNGLIRLIGQLKLAVFQNPQGLVQSGFNTYINGNASGERQLESPGTQSAGTIRAGALELSNTDIGRNLVQLITASTNYRGNARVISAVEQLVNELLALGRG